jgi:hypothetical protein
MALQGAYGMNRTVKAAVAAVVLVVGFIGALAAGPLEDGVAPYQRGDFAAALTLWRPLADQGNADAQHISGSCPPTARVSRRTIRLR